MNAPFVEPTTLDQAETMMDELHLRLNDIKAQITIAQIGKENGDPIDSLWLRRIHSAKFHVKREIQLVENARRRLQPPREFYRKTLLDLARKHLPEHVWEDICEAARHVYPSETQSLPA